MPGTFFGLDTALRGLEAQQTAIDVTGHNIANASTPGYSRQSVEMDTTAPFSDPSMPATGAGQIGTGVTIASITRAHDDFVQQQVLYQNQQQNSQQTQSDILTQISDVFNEPSSQGFSNLMSTYLGSWQTLANNPSDGPTRSVVVANGQSLAAGFNTAAQNLQAMQQNANAGVGTYVTQINTLTGEIAALNKQITSVTAIGQQPNDLMDKRDTLVSQLSQVADIQYTVDAHGAANISLTGSGALVQGVSSFALTTVPNATNPGFSDVAFASSPSTHLAITGGTLGGTLVARDQTIANRMTALDSLANNVMTAVNYYQTNGYDKNGNPGTAFFTGTSALSMAVNPAVVSDPSLLAAATTVKTPANPGPPPTPAVPNPEDGGNALAISQLQEAAFTPAPPATAQSETLQNQYSDIISTLGVESQQMQSNVQTGNVVLQNLTAQQSSVSAVSLNEEATNLVQYQNAYQAAARVISIMDSTISDMIQQLG